MPNNSQSVVQNYKVKQGSRSCSTTCGTPKLCTMWSKNKCAIVNMESSPFPTTMGISLTHFVSLSKTISMPLNNTLIGRSVMKSMEHTKKMLSWGVNWLQQTSRGRGQVVLLQENPASMHKCRDLMWQARLPSMAKQRRQSLADTQVPSKCAMHLLQQKLVKSTTRWNY